MCGCVYTSHIESVGHEQICPMKGINDKSETVEPEESEYKEPVEPSFEGSLSQDSLLDEVF